MEKIDCLGEVCPIPSIKLQERLKDIEAGKEIMIISDHSCTISNLEKICKAKKFSIDADEVINGVWEITIKKAPI